MDLRNQYSPQPTVMASVNIVFKVHKNSYWPQQKTIIVYYYIMILFKQFYWLSCCHLTFRKIWYCLIKTRIDLVSLSFSFNVIKQLVFCIGQYEFLWTLEINIHLSLKASVNIVFKVHKNSYWPQQNTIIVYYCNI
jgi:16S rRNA A1518/A1519 N6-dimethyltransferase RsmA/KsgA/DIM1 with predicted DNA glycosylase/AP lyase activity